MTDTIKAASPSDSKGETIQFGEPSSRRRCMISAIRLGTPCIDVLPGRHESITPIRLGTPYEVVGYIYKHVQRGEIESEQHYKMGWEVSGYAVTASRYCIDAVEFSPSDYATGARGALAAAKAYARAAIKESLDYIAAGKWG